MTRGANLGPQAVEPRVSAAGVAVARARQRMGISSRDLRAKLREAGLRPTRQRMTLGDLLFGDGDRHLTAEMLHQEARGVKSPPTLATVYNTLRQFADHGLLREIALYGGTTWYDTKTGPHFHFFIEERQELIDIPDEMIPALSIAAPDGMRVAGIDVVVRLRPAANNAEDKRRG
jgi:Fur family transcriptional regulator, iron response regulator